MNGMSSRRNGINCTGKHQPRFYRDWENISSSPRDRYTPNMHNRLCKCYGIPTPMLSKIHYKLCYQSSGSHDQGKVYWSSYRRIVLYCYHLKQKKNYEIIYQCFLKSWLPMYIQFEVALVLNLRYYSQLAMSIQLIMQYFNNISWNF